MKSIELRTSQFDSTDQVHEHLARELDFPDYYGANLDALYDCLGEVFEPIRVVLERDGGELDPDWVDRLAATFEDAALDNPDIEFEQVDAPVEPFVPQDLSPFGIGEENPYGAYFTGTSYLNMLSTEQCVVANVTFEPGCRNDWHVHLSKSGGGQILLVTGGRGWYQQWGMPARELFAGDVVNIPPNTKHWHGAARDSWFSHLAVEVPGEETSNAWLEPVADDDYDLLP